MRAREAERRPCPRRRITAMCLRLASHQHGRASWRGLCQPRIVSFQVLGAGDPGGPRIPPWRRQVGGLKGARSLAAERLRWGRRSRVVLPVQRVLGRVESPLRWNPCNRSPRRSGPHRSGPHRSVRLGQVRFGQVRTPVVPPERLAPHECGPRPGNAHAVLLRSGAASAACASRAPLLPGAGRDAAASDGEDHVSAAGDPARRRTHQPPPRQDGDMTVPNIVPRHGGQPRISADFSGTAPGHPIEQNPCDFGQFQRARPLFTQGSIPGPPSSPGIGRQAGCSRRGAGPRARLQAAEAVQMSAVAYRTIWGSRSVPSA